MFLLLRPIPLPFSELSGFRVWGSVLHLLGWPLGCLYKGSRAKPEKENVYMWGFPATTPLSN